MKKHHWIVLDTSGKYYQCVYCRKTFSNEEILNGLGKEYKYIGYTAYQVMSRKKDCES